MDYSMRNMYNGILLCRSKKIRSRVIAQHTIVLFARRRERIIFRISATLVGVKSEGELCDARRNSEKHSHANVVKAQGKNQRRKICLPFPFGDLCLVTGHPFAKLSRVREHPQSHSDAHNNENYNYNIHFKGEMLVKCTASPSFADACQRFLREAH